MKKPVLACVLLLAVTAWSSTLVAASLEQLTAYSPAVARVRVTSTGPVRADARHVVTLTECEVLEVLKGNLDATLTVSTPGGQLEDLGQQVAGAPRFKVGEEAVLFLRSPLRGTWQVTGLEQGKWTVVAGAAAPAQTVPRIDRGARPVAPSIPLSLRDLTGRVKAAVKEAAR
jgi:hypothetical protein